MINYFLEYHDIESGETYTSTFDSDEQRCRVVRELFNSEDFIVTDFYKDEECYCHAYSENECACGNFNQGVTTEEDYIEPLSLIEFSEVWETSVEVGDCRHLWDYLNYNQHIKTYKED